MRSVYLFTLAIFLACTACAPNGERASQQSVGSAVSSPTPPSTLPQVSPTTAATTTPNSSASTPPSDGVKRITVAELRSALERNEAIVVDVRAEAQYNTKHIKGARHIPAGEIATRAAELPRTKTIVTYCS